MRNVLDVRRRGAAPENDTAMDDQLDEQPPTPVGNGRAQVTANLATRSATVALWCALLLGPLGAGLAIWALYQPTAPAPAPVSASTEDPTEKATAAEFAHRVVTAWLTASRTDPDELKALVENPTPVPLTPQAFTVQDVSTAGIVLAAPGVWSVTVAATVTDESDERARRYLQVPVMVAGDHVAALTLPSIVSAPVVAKPPATTYRHQVSNTSPVTHSVAGFLAAYLTGSGDLSRYLAPATNLDPVSPAPFVDVDVVEVRSTVSADSTSPTPGDGQQIQVLVVAAGTVDQEQTLVTTYALALTSRAGRWEVSELEAAPAQGSQPLEPDQHSVVPPTPGGASSPTDG